MTKTFRDILVERQQPFATLEFFPPKKEALLHETSQLMEVMTREHQPAFVTVTYGAGGSSRERSMHLLEFAARNLDVPVVAHLTCVGHSVAEIDRILDRYEALGVRHILALRGDTPVGQEKFSANADGFGCARELVAHIAQRGTFSIAVAAYPEGHRDAHSEEEEFQYLQSKVEAGADLIITQLFFDNGLYYSFCEKLEHYAINAPVLPGIMPIRSLAAVERFTALCGASIPESLHVQLKSFENEEVVRKFGVEFAAQQCRELIEHGARGIHFYTLNRSESVAAVLRAQPR